MYISWSVVSRLSSLVFRLSSLFFLESNIPRVGDDDGDGGDGDGRIFPEYPSPILHAPRDIMSRKGKSLTPMF